MKLVLSFLLAAALGGAAEPGALLLRSIRPIDAHAHVFLSAPEVHALFERMNLRVVNVTVVDPYERGYETVEPQHRLALEVFRDSKRRAAWCSTFDPAGFEEPGFAQRVIASLDETFRQGAIGVKIYKAIGMDLKSKSGKHVMPDDTAFVPIFNAIAARGKTLYAHIAEPIGAWRPLDPKDPDYGYYKNAPRWHMYGRAGVPSKEEILAARDRMIRRHPKLRVVGCHLGSMEEDVVEIARRLDAYPNFAVDTAARVRHLTLQPREKVREFLLKYQDRILYATDFGAMPWDNGAQSASRWEKELELDWKYFATDETLEYQGRAVRGLALPEPVLRKLFRENALRWAPGIE